jgi:PAS domain S-box-containing protein
MAKQKILIVEDEFITAADLQSKLQDMGIDAPLIVDTGAAAIRAAGELMPDLILMDITLKGDMLGTEAAEKIREQFDIPCIFLTAHSDDQTVQKAIMADPLGYIIKPVDDRSFKITVNLGLYRQSIDKNLKRQEKITRALLNATTDALFIVDDEGMILGLNESLAKRTGKKADALLKNSFFELIPSGGISTRLAEEIRSGMKGKSSRFEEEFKGGWYDNNIYPIADAGGRITMVAVYSNDISNRIKAENEVKLVNNNLLKEKENLLVLTAALDNMDDIVFTTDAMGNIENVNSAFAKKLGYSPAEVQTKHISDLQYPGDLFAIDKNAFMAKSKTIWNGNLALKNKYGLKIRTSLRSNPVIQENRLICRIFVLRELL